MTQPREPMVVRDNGGSMAVAVVAVVVLVIIALVAIVAVVGATALLNNNNPNPPATNLPATNAPPSTPGPLLTLPAPGAVFSPYSGGAS